LGCSTEEKAEARAEPSGLPAPASLLVEAPLGNRPLRRRKMGTASSRSQSRENIFRFRGRSGNVRPTLCRFRRNQDTSRCLRRRHRKPSSHGHYKWCRARCDGVHWRPAAATPGKPASLSAKPPTRWRLAQLAAPARPGGAWLQVGWMCAVPPPTGPIPPPAPASAVRRRPLATLWPPGRLVRGRRWLLGWPSPPFELLAPLPARRPPPQKPEWKGGDSRYCQYMTLTCFPAPFNVARALRAFGS
jgi:hypothetical protein